MRGFRGRADGPGAAGLLGALLVVVAAAALAVPGARAEDAAPGSPAWVTASPVPDSSDVSVRWEAVEGATKYQIAHSTDGGGTWTPAAAVEAAPAGAEAAPEPAATLTGRHSLRLFSGGSLAQLAAAGEAACPGGIVIWVQDAAEEWFSYISGAPVFANARFVAAFPGGLDRRAVFVSLCEPAPAGAANTAQPVVDDGAADAPAEPVSHVISVRDASKSRIVRVRAGNDAGWGGWTKSNTIPASAPQVTVPAPRGGAPFVPVPVPSSPLTAGLAAPTGLKVSPQDGRFVIDWGAVTGALSYDVRLKPEGGELTIVATGLDGQKYTHYAGTRINEVGVRARDADGVSEWANLARHVVPPAGFMAGWIGSPPAGSASAASATATPPADESSGEVAKPSGLTVKREKYGRVVEEIEDQRTRLLLSFTSSAPGAGANIACSDTDGWYWHLCGWVDSTDDNAVKFDTVPGARQHPLKIVSYRRGAESPHPAGDFYLGGRHYSVAVRTISGGNSSAWTVSDVTRPLFPLLSGFTHTRGTGSVTLNWTPNFWTTGYNFECYQYTPGSPGSRTYTPCKSLTDQDDTLSTHTVTIDSWTVSSDGNTTTHTIDDSKVIDIAIQSTNKWSIHEDFGGTERNGWALAPLIDPLGLTVSGVTDTAATLTVAGHTMQWWYSANRGPHSTCQGPVAANTAALTGLTPGLTYIYAAYSDSACSASNFLERAGAFSTATLTASRGANATGATLTIADHGGGAWSYKGTSGGLRARRAPTSRPGRRRR